MKRLDRLGVKVNVDVSVPSPSRRPNATAQPKPVSPPVLNAWHTNLLEDDAPCTHGMLQAWQDVTTTTTTIRPGPLPQSSPGRLADVSHLLQKMDRVEAAIHSAQAVGHATKQLLDTSAPLLRDESPGPKPR